MSGSIIVIIPVILVIAALILLARERKEAHGVTTRTRPSIDTSGIINEFISLQFKCMNTAIESGNFDVLPLLGNTSIEFLNKQNNRDKSFDDLVCLKLNHIEYVIGERYNDTYQDKILDLMKFDEIAEIVGYGN